MTLSYPPPPCLPLQGAAYDAFKTTAIKTDGVVFAQTTDAKVAAEAGLTAHGIVAIKNHVGM